MNKTPTAKFIESLKQQENMLSMLFFVVLILIISTLAIIYSPYLLTGPLGEQRHYISISYYMAQSNNWLILRDDAGFYCDKGPFLFWLTNIFWKIFGIRNWVLRAIPAIFAIGTLFAILKAFSQLWPNYRKNAWIAPAVLVGSYYYLKYIPSYLHDIPLIFFSVLAINGLLHVSNNKFSGWAIFGLANAFGLLTKGPIIFVFTTVPAFIAALKNLLKPTHRED